MQIDNVVLDFNVVAQHLRGSSLVTLAKTSLSNRLEQSEISQEEKDRLIVDFDKQLSLFLLPEVIKLSFSFPLLVKKVRQADEKIEMMIAEKNTLSTEIDILDMVIANAPEKIEAEIEILIKQRDGITNYYKSKTLKSLTELTALFAQNGLSPDDWVKAKIRAISTSLSGHMV